MRVLVCGGRDYDDGDRVDDVLTDIRIEFGPITMLIQGGADGADGLAAEWAERNGVPYLTVPANWKAHGNAAGPIRNAAMLTHLPELVVAFPGGKGTANMVAQAKEKGVRVEEISP